MGDKLFDWLDRLYEKRWGYYKLIPYFIIACLTYELATSDPVYKPIKFFILYGITMFIALWQNRRINQFFGD